MNAQGIATEWADARTVLRAENRYGATLKSSLLSATCDYAPDAALQTKWKSLGKVVITQGFIAANDDGETVLLGRGGSDTSGAYFAAKLGAVRLEILDRRAARSLQRESTLRADRTTAACIALRRGAGDCEQRRQGIASALHFAGPAIRHSAARVRHAQRRDSKAP